MQLKANMLGALGFTLGSEKGVPQKAIATSQQERENGEHRIYLILFFWFENFCLVIPFSGRVVQLAH